MRAVCLVTKDQNIVVCGDWDTGKLRYGWRADAATAWTQSDNPPSADQATPIDMLLGFLGKVLSEGGESTRGSSMHGYWRTTGTGAHWVNRR